MSNFNFQKPIPDLVEQISQLSNFYQNKNQITNYGASTNDGFNEKKITSSTGFEIGDNDLNFKSIKILQKQTRGISSAANRPFT